MSNIERAQTDGSAEAAASDTEAALQKELQREAAEHARIDGDVGANRNLSGSSTWETLPAPADAGDAADEPGAK